jgi:hypothetical protein
LACALSSENEGILIVLDGALLGGLGTVICGIGVDWTSSFFSSLLSERGEGSFTAGVTTDLEFSLCGFGF